MSLDIFAKFADIDIDVRAIIKDGHQVCDLLECDHGILIIHQKIEKFFFGRIEEGFISHTLIISKTAPVSILRYFLRLTELRLIGYDANMTDKTPTLNFKLNDLLLEKKLSVQDLADASGITRMAIYNMINGYHRGLKFDTIARLCYGFAKLLEREITPNDLMAVEYPRK